MTTVSNLFLMPSHSKSFKAAVIILLHANYHLAYYYMCPYMTSFSKAFITTSPRILENLRSHLRIALKCTEVSNSRGTCVLRNSSKEKRYLAVIKTSALQSAANYSVLHVALFCACSSKKG